MSVAVGQRRAPPPATAQAEPPAPTTRNARARPRSFVRRLHECAAGVSAVEFALLAPVLVIGAFSTADAGMAIYEKMMIGQALRAAAQRVMSGGDEDDVRAVLREVASQNFAIAEEGVTQVGSQDGVVDDGASPDGALSIGVGRYCACPGATFVQVGCTTVCDSGPGATEFYRLTASKTFDGVMLPGFDLSGSVTVLAE